MFLKREKILFWREGTAEKKQELITAFICLSNLRP